MTTYPTTLPEASAHEAALIGMLQQIQYIDPLNGGGGVHAVRVPKDAIEWQQYGTPSIIVAYTGSTLVDRKSRGMNGCVFQEDHQFEIFTVNANFDTEGSGRLGGVIAGDPGSFATITDVRRAIYGKGYQVVSPWPNGSTIDCKVFPVSPTVQRWAMSGLDDPSRVTYRLLVRTNGIIHAE